ncbi:MAG: Bug family tripartite tricarboxylate transporter substrate binding protein [Xanthobacteraceae bacterium]
MKRRTFLRLAAGTLAVPTLSAAGSVWAADYPTRPVRIIVGFAAGGGTDIVARLIGQALSERLGQPFVIENRPGAATNLATEVVANAPADGYTLLLADGSAAINATLYNNLNFNFIRDIAPVAGIIRVANIMVVNPTFPASTVPQFVAYAKANPGALNTGSGGKGDPPHVSGELFKMMSGIDMLYVPYRGLAAALSDLIAGRLQVVFGTMPSTIEHVRAGTLRALAVTSAARSDLLPDVPALNEFLPGYEASQWYGIAAPKNTPPAVVDTLNSQINAAVADPKVKTRLAELGGTPLVGTPADFGRHIAAETDKWRDVVKFSGATAD